MVNDDPVAIDGFPLLFGNPSLDFLVVGAQLLRVLGVPVVEICDLRQGGWQKGFRGVLARQHVSQESVGLLEFYLSTSFSF
jgi:hypothetical protein